MFGKVNPAPAVSIRVRMVFWTLPEPLKPVKTSQKHDIHENHCFFRFLPFLAPVGHFFGPKLEK